VATSEQPVSNQLNIGDRVRFLPPLPLAGRTGTIVNVLRDCSGLLYLIKLDGKPYRVAGQLLQIVDAHREGLEENFQ
jgi:hypothetical protein